MGCWPTDEFPLHHRHGPVGLVACTHTFDQPGTYDHACAIHPRMTGRVVVSTGP